MPFSTVSQRPARWLILATLALVFSGCLLAQAPDDFSVVLLPDTQFYSESHPTIFSQQTQWIVNNRTTWNIQFVIGEGDIVNTPGNNFEWVNADASIKILDNAGMPYALAIGNHDYDGVLPQSRGTTAYNQWFGVSRYSGYPWYGGHSGATNENFAAFFTANGQRYLVIVLEYYPRDAALSWAESVMNANPDAKVFITTHSFLFTDGTRGDSCDTSDMAGTTGRNAQTVWNQVLRKHANVQLVVSGHLVATNSAHRTDLGDNGNLVNQIFTNFQNWTNGGNGYLRILKFRPSLNRIEVFTYSPTLNNFLTDGVNQFTLPINNGATATVGAIDGKVRTPSCMVIMGAKVTTGAATATTDVNGRYTIQNLPGTQQYPVSITASGYRSASATATVFNGFSTQTDFYPTQTVTNSCVLSKTDPSVTICTPAASSTVASPVHINAGTTAKVGVQYMQVYVDGIKQQTVFGPALDLNQAMSTGTHRLTVQSKLNNAAVVKNSISITVGTGGGGTPGVTMTSPVNGGTYTSPVPVNATATSNVAITQMQLLVDNVQTFQVSGNTMNTTAAMAAGSHVVTVQAVDANNVTFKQSATITVSSSSGSGVTMTSPINGNTYTSPVPVKATAKSNVAISFMQLYVDGVKKFQVSGSTMNTTSAMAAGTHRVTVQAQDANKVLLKQTVNITVH